MIDLTPEAAALLILAAAVLLGAGCIILALRGLTEAVNSAAAETNGLEGVVEAVRRVLDERLHRVSADIDDLTAAVRETAEQAPAAVIAQRDRLAADNERLVGAATRILAYTPDPEAGTYQAGVAAVKSYAHTQVAEVLK